MSLETSAIGTLARYYLVIWSIRGARLEFLSARRPNHSATKVLVLGVQRSASKIPLQQLPTASIVILLSSFVVD